VTKAHGDAVVLLLVANLLEEKTLADLVVMDHLQEVMMAHGDAVALQLAEMDHLHAETAHHAEMAHHVEMDHHVAMDHLEVAMMAGGVDLLPDALNLTKDVTAAVVENLTHGEEVTEVVTDANHKDVMHLVLEAATTSKILAMMVGRP